MSISSEPELIQAFQQIELLQKGLVSLKREYPRASARNLAILAEGPLDQIAELQADIQQYLLTSAGEDFLGIRLVGPHIHLRDTPVSVITAVLDGFRKGVQAIAELKLFGGRSTRPTAELKRVCDFQVLALAPGSLRVLIKLPQSEQPPLNPAELDIGSQALDDFLAGAQWAASDADASVLDEMFPNTLLRKTLLTEIQKVVPRPRGALELVEFSGPRVTKRNTRPFALVRASRDRINSAIDTTAAVERKQYRGVLREIDLDDCTFSLRGADLGGETEIRCTFPEHLLETAKESLDRMVEVTGTRRVMQGRRVSTPLEVTRLEIVEEDDSDQPS